MNAATPQRFLLVCEWWDSHAEVDRIRTLPFTGDLARAKAALRAIMGVPREDRLVEHWIPEGGRIEERATGKPVAWFEWNAWDETAVEVTP